MRKNTCWLRDPTCKDSSTLPLSTFFAEVGTPSNVDNIFLASAPLVFAALTANLGVTSGGQRRSADAQQEGRQR
jgi:hypothetical protein